MAQGLDILAGQRRPQRRHAVGLQSVTEVEGASGGTNAPLSRWPFRPPQSFFNGGVGGLRSTPIGTVDGGLELLVEFWLEVSPQPGSTLGLG